MLDKKNHFFCQSCSKKLETSVILVCCLRIFCPACQKIKHDCFQPKLLPILPTKHKFCSRCNTKIARIQCSNCLHKQFCIDCSNTLHLLGKFNYHIKYEIQGKKGQKCMKHHVIKELQTKSKTNDCLNCFYDKQMIPCMSKSKLQASFQQIKNRLLLQKQFCQNIQIAGEQNWKQIQSEVKKKFQILHEQLENLEYQIEQTIQKKKIAMHQYMAQKYQIIETLENQHKNALLLFQQQLQQGIKFFLSHKLKHILSSISHIQKVTLPEYIFIPNSIQSITSQIKQIAVQKLLTKQKQSLELNDKKLMNWPILKSSKSQNNIHMRFKSNLTLQSFVMAKNLNASINNEEDIISSKTPKMTITQHNQPKKLKNSSSTQYLLKHCKNNVSDVYKSQKYLLPKQKFDPIKQIIAQKKKTRI